ncbi:MAG: T9SS type A sorting domain-containing protein [Bacteroidales bacterium]|nr:T9SS type A sorting domain-containing protein [Bacteroidales bacterium]
MDFKIFPDPFNDVINIECPEFSENDILVTMYDMRGIIYFKEYIKSHKLEFNTENLLSGNYLMVLYSQGKIFSQKLIKKPIKV